MSDFSHKLNDVGFPALLHRMLSRISMLQQVGEVTAALRAIARLCGCNAAVFTCFDRHQDTRESYRHIVACPASWCDLYIGSRWFCNDPFLQYARFNSEPASEDRIVLRTSGQEAFRAAAKLHDFQSIAVVPAHAPMNQARLGALYMTSPEASYFNPRSMAFGKIYLRAIACELLDWMIQRLRGESMTRLQLSDGDLMLIAYAAQGFRTKDIARLIQANPAAIDQRFRRVAAKAGVRSRASLIKLARENSLIEH